MDNGWYKILNGCKRSFSYFWDCIFPNFCLECGQEGEWWCGICRQKFPFQFTVFLPQNLGQDKIYLDQVLAFFNYTEDCPPALLLKQFKYSYVYGIKNVWQSILTEQAKYLFDYKDFTLVPVPLHGRRERERGFNQAYILAELISKLSGWSGVVNEGLKRIRYTECQAGLGRVERLSNLRDAFVWVDVSVPNKILLVDDVYTTGATMNECAKILKKAGVKQVFGLVLAKGQSLHSAY